MSGLGEPLSAEIEILATTPEELAELTAAIAPEEAYTMQGLERPGFHNMIKVEVKKKANGTPVIKLSTAQPVTDPFLDMLVQVDWPTGRLVREFTLLLDPPDYTNSSVASPTSAGSKAQAPKAADSGNSATSTQPASNGASARSSRTARNNTQRHSNPARNAPAPAADTAAADTSVTTARGDSLVRIARQNQVEGVNLDQMLISIFRANKGAFVNDNINRLKVGQIIRIPSAEEAQSISAGEAAREVRAQSADWQNYRNRLAGAVAEAPAAREEGGSAQQSATGKVSASAQDKSIPEATGPRDVVKLSKNDAAAGQAASENKGLQEKLTALQEEAIAREKSIKEANDRAALLEKQIQDMQKLLALKSQAMSDIQKNAAASPAPASPATTEAAQPETPAAAPSTPATAEPAPAGSTPPAQAAPAASPEKAKPVPAIPAAAPAVLPAEDATPDLLDDLTQNPLLLGAAGLLIVLLGAWLLVRNRRKRGLDGFEKSILTSGGLKANTVFGNTLGGTVNTGDTSFLTDFSQSSSGMIDTNDVDPIAEAEVYMAYGRDKQAEEILREAISKDPARHELQLKLLEIYAGRNDSAAFETTAGELYTTLGAHDPVWTRVAELGRQVEPENPLYQAVAAPAHDHFSPVAAASAAGALAAAGVLGAQAAHAHESNEIDFESSANAVEDLSQHTRPGSDLLQAEDADFSESFSSDADSSALDFDLGADDDQPALEAGSDSRDAEVTEEIVMGGEPAFSQPQAVADEALDSNADAAEPASELDFQLDTPADQDSGGAIDFDLGSVVDNAGDDSAGTLNVDLDPLSADAEEDIESTLQLDLSSFDQSQGTAGLADDILAKDTSPQATPASSDPFADLPDLNLDDAASASELPSGELHELSASSAEQELANLPEFEPSFESPAPEISFDVADSKPADELASTASAPDADLQLPAFEQDVVKTPTDVSESIIMESTPEQDQALDLDFNVDLDEVQDDDALPAPAGLQADAQEVDLSGISFDLDDNTNTDSTSDSALDTGTEQSLAPESSEVDTKLDLVTAYIDMGDNEGAKELLEEILQEGGPNQRLRAQDMLKTLG